MRMHEAVSAQMLSHIDLLAPVAESSLSEHTEYQPDDAKHPIEPYIVMVADAFDAMTSTRSYRQALPTEVAIAELREKAGTQFHPECTDGADPRARTARCGARLSKPSPAARLGGHAAAKRGSDRPDSATCCRHRREGSAAR